MSPSQRKKTKQNKTHRDSFQSYSKANGAELSVFQVYRIPDDDNLDFP